MRRPGRAIRRVVQRFLTGRPLRAANATWERVRQLAPWRLAARWRHARANRGLAEGVMAIRPGLELLIDPRSRASFEYFCFRSHDMVRELDAFLALGAGRKCLIDVGAFHGIFALCFTQRPDTRALTLEPAPWTFEILRRNVELNGGTAITPLSIAAGDREGVIAMERDWEHLRAVAAQSEGQATTQVTVRPLARVCAELKFEPDLIKVDVEGFELDVLRGAGALLDRDDLALLIEVHPRLLRRLGHSPVELFDLLAEHGQVPRALTGQLLGRQEFADEDGDFRFYAVRGR
jgi:FkbM family methyltransferase